jgi:tetratricopeptide (TPR) repeat protein
MNADTTPSEFFVAGGTLRPDSPSYVNRPADEDLFGLTLAGKFCYVLTARQMGKSSLVVRTARRLSDERDVSTARITLDEIGTVTINQWYLGLLTKLKADLKLSVDPEAWWTQRAALGEVQRFTGFLREVVLEEIKGRVVIFVDEIDYTLRLGFADDFFAAIRAMYNARAGDPEFNRLTFVLLGVAAPSDLIKDSSRTPFNIGQAIDLREFSRKDADVLQRGLSAACPEQGEAIFARIFYWTNGHPYLTQKLCQAVIEAKDDHWNDERVDVLVERLFLSEEARKETNLQFVRNSVAFSPKRRKLLGLYKKVYEGKAVPEDERSLDQNRLKLFGLVRAEKGMLKVRNEIYRRAFNLDWIKQNTPINWAVRIAVVSTILVLVLASFIAYYATQQKRLSAEAQALALVQQFQSTGSAEVRITSLAGLFGLPNYEGQARQLFQNLEPEEQRALFNLADPRTVAGQLITVTKGLYTDLNDNEQNNELLRAMAQPLRKLDDPKATNLATEIEQWLQGRTYYGHGEYQQAVREYDVAIRLNPYNPGTYFDLGLAYAGLNESNQALTDLESVLNLNSSETWKARVQQALISDSQLYSALWREKEKYKTLVALVPSPTNTLTIIHTPTLRPTPTPTSTPTPRATQSPTFPPTLAATSRVTRSPTAANTSGPETLRLVAPAFGEGPCRSPITFRWNGSLGPGQAYQVRIHYDLPDFSGTVVLAQSELLITPSWVTSVPGQVHANGQLHTVANQLYWGVSIVSDGKQTDPLVWSMFYFSTLNGRSCSP